MERLPAKAVGVAAAKLSKLKQQRQSQPGPGSQGTKVLAAANSQHNARRPASQRAAEEGDQGSLRTALA
jgi:hypothetical protein